jgi:CHAT domain-containing protein
VARHPDQHLNLYELTALASEKLPGNARLRPSEAEHQELEDHLVSCKECRHWFEQEAMLLSMSKRLPNLGKSQGNSPCPSEQEWMELAAGLHAPLETHKQIEHAMDCPRCAVLLKTASEQFADDLSGEEARFLSGLTSSDPKWQKQLARRIREPGSGEIPSPGKKAHDQPLFPRYWLAAAGAAILALAILSFTYFRTARTVDRLLTVAYSEHRTNDLRMAGSRYNSVEAFRGSTPTGLHRPTALLEAEVLIAKELASKPDDPFWLDAQGRADLMNDDYSSALSSLQRASLYAPVNQAIRLDLASAYFLRAEELKRPEDYGRAADLLGRVLATDPRNEIARFNHAIVSERLLLYDQAVEDWRRYLQVDPGSPWSNEARERLRNLEEKMRLEKDRSERPILGPAEFLAALADNRDATVRDEDLRIERYFDVALSEWIPEAFSSPSASSAETTHRALDRLSEILTARHQDPWFADLLDELQKKPISHHALPSLADAVKMAQTTDLDHARRSAVDALRLFQASRNAAGEQTALFELSYADQLSHRTFDCLGEARSGTNPRLAGRYPWLTAQMALEAAACTDLNDETARRLASEALSVARLHHYPSLELRALTFLAGLYQYMGDASSAWRYSLEGLERYWQGDFAAMRGYSLCAGLDLVAEDSEQWFLEVQILQQAHRFIGDEPDLELRAMHQYRLANALALAGDYSAAEQSLQTARTLLLHSADGTRKNNLEFEAQVSSAKLELLHSEPEAAIKRLEPWKPTARNFSDQDLVFDYFRYLGLSYFAAGKPIQARQDLTEAVTLAEESLARNGDERERLIWSRKSDEVYRALVQLSLPGSPRETLDLWEWSKAASLRGVFPSRRPRERQNVPIASARAPAVAFVVPQDTLVISYAVLPAGIFAWTYGRDGVRPYRLPISDLELEQLTHAFADHCARPDSDLTVLQRESRELYRKLISPAAPLPASYKYLVIEPDKSLWLVPFEALLDQQDVYLGDRFSISFSPGLNYLAVSPRPQEITKDSPVLVAGDPVTTGSAPLDDAEAEANGIARQFRFSKVLMQAEVGSAQIAKHMESAEIFHFSGHATASPDGVGLVLGDSIVDAATARVSGFSHLKLAVLSACNTANGTTGVFDDRNSLARLLVGAGILDVVASRWTVDSRATSSLMQEFYAQLLSGRGVSSSLQEASHKLRQKKEYTHPFYWASFSVFGRN